MYVHMQCKSLGVVQVFSPTVSYRFPFSAALQAAAADMKQADRGFKTAMDEEVANNLGKVVGEFAGAWAILGLENR